MSIKSSDLRLKNLVLVDGKIKIVDAKLLLQLEKAEFIGFDTSGLQPIELTEEILLKAGFEKHWSVFILKTHSDFGVYISLANKEHEFCYQNEHDTFVTLTKLKYLHQLQNIYDIICKTELNINL